MFPIRLIPVSQSPVDNYSQGLVVASPILREHSQTTANCIFGPTGEYSSQSTHKYLFPLFDCTGYRSPTHSLVQHSLHASFDPACHHPMTLRIASAMIVKAMPAGETHDTTGPYTNRTTPVPYDANSTAHEPRAATWRRRKVISETTSNRTAIPSVIQPNPSTGTDNHTLPHLLELRGVHKASLVAGPGGVRCLAVGLAVLQRVCPPVHRRLARAAAAR